MLAQDLIRTRRRRSLALAAVAAGAGGAALGVATGVTAAAAAGLATVGAATLVLGKLTMEVASAGPSASSGGRTGSARSADVAALTGSVERLERRLLDALDQMLCLDDRLTALERASAAPTL